MTEQEERDEVKAVLIVVVCIIACAVGSIVLEIIATLITGYGPYF